VPPHGGTSQAFKALGEARLPAARAEEDKRLRVGGGRPHVSVYAHICAQAPGFRLMRGASAPLMPHRNLRNH